MINAFKLKRKKSRATTFSKEWENEVSEDAEAKSFWDDFFNGLVLVAEGLVRLNNR